jgi:hypothetical protein
MKTKQKLAVLFIVIMSATSCIKEEQIMPSDQVVTYTLKCEDCLIYLEDDKWNAGNELQRSKNQYFNVKGSFRYQFTNTTGLDSVTAIVSVSVLRGDSQVIYLNIWDNQGRATRVIDTLGFSPNWINNYEYELRAKLDLR